ncbi:uncharacterized protein LOC116429801 [Nomia melanderi]|uniref:uncharacterized protein LOC116429801 n=1 Tax=Nomia melanderi TaxID=2448451 RepID=UPI003FCE45F2
MFAHMYIPSKYSSHSDKSGRKEKRVLDWDKEIRQARLEQCYNSFSEVQLALEIEDEDHGHTPEREHFENQYYLAADRLSDRLKALRVDSRASISTNSDVESPIHIIRQTTNNLLPKVELKPFDGNLIEWRSYHDTFKSLVHDNEELIPVQKFHLLKNSLIGGAATVISTLNASETNYKVAWDLLCQRCNKPRKTVNAHLKLFFELPEVSRDTPTKLQQLAEQAQMHVNALKSLGQPIEQWNAILVYSLGNKLDKNTRRAWERTLDDDKFPTFDELIAFINKQARGEELDSDLVSSSNFSNTHLKNKAKFRGQSYVSTKGPSRYNCAFCKGEHAIYSCSKFLKITVRDRFNFVKKAQLCLNCLRPNHTITNCRLGYCKKCEKPHHTLLHFPTEILQSYSTHLQASPSPSTPSNIETAPSLENTKHALLVSSDSEVLLGTAIIKILDQYGKAHFCRVLLDSGSQSHFITESFAKKLNLKTHRLNSYFSGIGQHHSTAESIVKTSIRSMKRVFQSQVAFVVLPSITGLLPTRQVPRESLNIPKHIELADPNFDQPNEVDALLGNTLYYELLLTEQIRLQDTPVILQNTHVGWLVTGEIAIKSQVGPQNSIKRCHLTTSLNKQLERFWAIEEIPEKQFLSPEEAACEQHFKQYVSRDHTGRYTVRLPFNEKKGLLGDSKGLALKRFVNLENKLHKNPKLLEQYSQFLNEYIELGHMTEVKDDSPFEGFYLPRHSIVKDTSNTTRIRVVFDASAKGSTGISLNDTLLTGPTIQDILFSILLRFRCHNFVLTADVEKMFRQINIHHEDRAFQKILWRDSRQGPLKTYCLNTVTYGTACAPFLAIRCLQQTAEDESENFPIAARTFKTDFYVDDLLTGASTFEVALILRNELIQLAKAGDFHLRQWSSNDPRLIEDLLATNQHNSLCLDPSETKKTLGIFWNPSRDDIVYTIEKFPDQPFLTKRIILSQIAQLFDPFGLLGPIIIKAKIIMQDLWKAAVDWHEPVSKSIEQAWLTIANQLDLLNRFSIHRRIALNQAVELQLHGFCDASESAYGACVYIRSTNKQGQHAVELLCAKSRVAPIKTNSLPRLELCAAKLLANLYREVIKSLKNCRFSTIRFWSDSTITTLHWIRTSAHLLKTFVANRVNEIQTLTDPQAWGHVRSSENPADFISRGQLPAEFIENSTWLHGPHWLTKNPSYWPTYELAPIDIPEKRQSIVLTVQTTTNDLFERFSSFESLVRADCFAKEIHSLKGSKVLKTGKLVNLNPFLDDEDILRVGGKLKHAPLRYTQKHPILLPHRHKVTEMIIRQEHLRYFHAEAQATLYAVRQNCWPIDGKGITKQIV